eukprot:5072232-Prymnesium_polylepis.1
MADAGAASLNGSLFIGAGEADVQQGVALGGGALTIQVTLQRDAFSAWSHDSVVPLSLPPAQQDA